MTGEDLINYIKKNGLEGRHFFIDVEGYVSPIQTIFENDHGDVFLAQEGRGEHDYLDDCNNRSRYFEEWFDIISYDEAKKLWCEGNRGFVVLRSDGSDCYAECYDSFEDIPGDSYFGLEKDINHIELEKDPTIAEEVQNVLDCLVYWESRVGEYVMELGECSESEDECMMEDTRRASAFLKSLPENIGKLPESAEKKVYFLKDLSEGSVDAVIIAKTSSEDDVRNAIIQAKQKDEYQWDDIVNALPDDCEVYDTWSVKKVYY